MYTKVCIMHTLLLYVLDKQKRTSNRFVDSGIKLTVYGKRHSQSYNITYYSEENFLFFRNDIFFSQLYLHSINLNFCITFFSLTINNNTI